MFTKNPQHPQTKELKQFSPLESTSPQSPSGVNVPSRHCDGAAERKQETKTTGVNSPYEPSPKRRKLLHRHLSLILLRDQMHFPTTHTEARILEDTEHAVVRGRALPVEPYASASPMAPHCTLRHSTTPPLCFTEHCNNKQATLK
ncbi:hypothetical protein DQ04_12661020 [Trypanosoma grayi]|uniref:hypothetical protein n=1 Tax=Trypanosoma grayi TaxID=71804 RepID=UPI0004F4396B|nr:hypothetical protein DQ04_12661020 [Trypanosoma grayi]KEG06707.1 hypothetical protein DQ04_12661020 [Trypanosoma grayi]